MNSSDEILKLRRKIQELEKELEEQCRLNGMGASREAVLFGKIERIEKELILCNNPIHAKVLR